MNMQRKYRCFRREGGPFYWQENGTSKRGCLKTKNRAEAERLLLAMNEAHQQPIMNLALGRAYLSAHDPRLITRTSQSVMDEMAQHGIPTTQTRCKREFKSRAYDGIRDKPLVETKVEEFLTICHKNGNSANHYLRRLHNLALNLGWLAWPVLHKAVWPKIHSQSKRAITGAEHPAIVASEQNAERKAFYQLLYETGAAQTDASNLTSKHID